MLDLYWSYLAKASGTLFIRPLASPPYLKYTATKCPFHPKVGCQLRPIHPSACPSVRFPGTMKWNSFEIWDRLRRVAPIGRHGGATAFLGQFRLAQLLFALERIQSCTLNRFNFDSHRAETRRNFEWAVGCGAPLRSSPEPDYRMGSRSLKPLYPCTYGVEQN